MKKITFNLPDHFLLFNSCEYQENHANDSGEHHTTNEKLAKPGTYFHYFNWHGSLNKAFNTDLKTSELKAKGDINTANKHYHFIKDDVKMGRYIIEFAEM